MMEMELTPATIIIGLIIAALAVLAVRRLLKRGTCDHKDCEGCSAADKMVADMENATRK